MELPAPDARKLLQSWMEWERGDVTPGRVMANLKTGGLRQLLEALAEPAATEPAVAEPAAAAAAPGPEAAPGPVEGKPPSWAPVV
jgi:hypothetical protein